MGAESAIVPGVWSAHPDVPPIQGNPFTCMPTLAFVKPITVIIMGGAFECAMSCEKTVAGLLPLLSCAGASAGTVRDAANTSSNENVENRMSRIWLSSLVQKVRG